MPLRLEYMGYLYRRDTLSRGEKLNLQRPPIGMRSNRSVLHPVYFGRSSSSNQLDLYSVIWS